MRDDGTQSGKLQFVQGLIQRRRNRVVGKLDQEIVLLIERVARGIVLDVLQIFKAQMEIAPGGQNETPREDGLKLIAALPHQAGTERVVLIRVRGADDVRDAVGDGHFAHRLRDFERFGAVVDAGKYVAMNIHHRQPE